MNSKGKNCVAPQPIITNPEDFEQEEDLPFFQQEEQLSLTAEQLSPLSSLNDPMDISGFTPLMPRTLKTKRWKRELYGLPPLTVAVRAKLNNANLPKDYKQAPRLQDWLEEITEIFNRVDSLSNEAKVRKALHWCTVETKELLADMDSVKAPNFEEFKWEMCIIFADSVRDVNRSNRKLHSLVGRFEPIGMIDSQKLKIFNKLFQNEADKLMRDPALIANSNAVKLYRTALDPVLQDSHSS
ncbi:hypothetical protein BT96DRAFT_948756 [Gymnopus androsaceus JB14]|uniref:Uncharacterized protein n=1 Tax=Gymnopus androsaceus JB14 TaxID=1447944 RepID=A0A6A4GMD8_9AGAR|nr:hypothetical protein BT96DRAFT_948756 [Gymnopus androsaceus JB14]